MNIRAKIKDWDGGMLHVNGLYIKCKQPNWWQRLRGRTHDETCLSCACRAEMKYRGYAPAIPIKGSGFMQVLDNK